MVRPLNLYDTDFTGLRGRIADIIESNGFIIAISALIVINAVTLGLETSPQMMERYGPYLLMTDRLVLIVFVAEILLKLFVYRLSFFRAGWNVFDFAIVLVSLMPAAGPFAVIRTLRILRVLRLMSVVPQMRRIVSALLGAIPGMASIIGVLLILFYVSAVWTTQIFGAHPDPKIQELFGSLSNSMYTLFQVMTLENWADGIAGPTLEHFSWAWAFFVAFIIITSFAVLNLFIGIIVDAMNMAHDFPPDHKTHKKGAQDTQEDQKQRLTRRLYDLESEIREIRTVIEKSAAQPDKTNRTP